MKNIERQWARYLLLAVITLYCSDLWCGQSLALSKRPDAATLRTALQNTVLSDEDHFDGVFGQGMATTIYQIDFEKCVIDDKSLHLTSDGAWQAVVDVAFKYKRATQQDDILGRSSYRDYRIYSAKQGYVMQFLQVPKRADAYYVGRAKEYGKMTAIGESQILEKDFNGFSTYHDRFLESADK